MSIDESQEVTLEPQDIDLLKKTAPMAEDFKPKITVYPPVPGRNTSSNLPVIKSGPSPTGETKARSGKILNPKTSQ